MKNRHFNLLYILFLSGCGGFLNPFDDAFLDWNNNHVERAHIEQILKYCSKYKGVNDYNCCLENNGLSPKLK